MNITTDKEAFEYTKTQLLIQKEKSFINESCAYRGYSKSLKDRISQSIVGKNYDNMHDGLDEHEYDSIEDSFLDKLYSSDPDVKCAVGHLITDKCYDMSIEEMSANADEVMSAVIGSNPSWQIDDNSVDMLMRMQQIHDMREPSDWKILFERFNFDSSGRYIHDSTLD